MKTVSRLVLLAAVAGLGVWLWMLLFPSPEKVVRNKISALAAAATFDARVSNLIRASKASSVAGMFASDAQIVIETTGAGARTLSGSDEIREAAIGGFGTLPSLNVQFLDITAQVGADRQSAEANCTAQVRVGEGKDYEVQELRFRLRKIDGDWRISRVETVKTLQ